MMGSKSRERSEARACSGKACENRIMASERESIEARLEKKLGSPSYASSKRTLARGSTNCG